MSGIRSHVAGICDHVQYVWGCLDPLESAN